MKTITAQGLAFDAQTRDWTKLVTCEFPNRQQALDWIKFQRDWLKGLHIVPCGHDFQPDPKCDLVDVCTKCGEERA